MPTYAEIIQELSITLSKVYDGDEALALAEMLIEELKGWTKSQSRLRKQEAVPLDQIAQIKRMEARLLAGEPLQYILGYAWFMGEKFQVASGVLIPRPETEELVEWIKQDFERSSPKRILDIGTGSGCVAITLSKAFPKAEVWGVDISAEAMTIAQNNAAQLNSTARFKRVDILNQSQWESLGHFDLIVSNPPYISEAEKEEMHPNVLEHEPHTALFVSDTDPLIFYRVIAQFGREAMESEVAIYYEINANLGEEMLALMTSSGYSNPVLKKDMQGKNRMLKATR